MDVDWSHRSWPPGADDPENVLVEPRTWEMSGVTTRVSAPGSRWSLASSSAAMIKNDTKGPLRSQPDQFDLSQVQA